MSENFSATFHTQLDLLIYEFPAIDLMTCRQFYIYQNVSIGFADIQQQSEAKAKWKIASKILCRIFPGHWKQCDGTFASQFDELQFGTLQLKCI